MYSIVYSYKRMSGNIFHHELCSHYLPLRLLHKLSCNHLYFLMILLVADTTHQPQKQPEPHHSSSLQCVNAFGPPVL